MNLKVGVISCLDVCVVGSLSLSDRILHKVTPVRTAARLSMSLYFLGGYVVDAEHAAAPAAGKEPSRTTPAAHVPPVASDRTAASGAAPPGPPQSQMPQRAPGVGTSHQPPPQRSTAQQSQSRSPVPVDREAADLSSDSDAEEGAMDELG